MKKYIFLLLALSVIACTPEKKLQRWLTKYPGLVKTDTIIRTDTVTISDTVQVENTIVDTVFSTDTIRQVTTANGSVSVRPAGKGRVSVKAICRNLIITIERKIDHYQTIRQTTHSVRTERLVPFWYWIVVVVGLAIWTVALIRILRR